MLDRYRREGEGNGRGLRRELFLFEAENVPAEVCTPRRSSVGCVKYDFINEVDVRIVTFVRWATSYGTGSGCRVSFLQLLTNPEYPFTNPEFPFWYRIAALIEIHRIKQRFYDEMDDAGFVAGFNAGHGNGTRGAVAVTECMISFLEWMFRSAVW